MTGDTRPQQAAALLLCVACVNSRAGLSLSSSPASTYSIVSDVCSSLSLFSSPAAIRSAGWSYSCSCALFFSRSFSGAPCRPWATTAIRLPLFSSPCFLRAMGSSARWQCRKALSTASLHPCRSCRCDRLPRRPAKNAFPPLCPTSRQPVVEKKTAKLPEQSLHFASW